MLTRLFIVEHLLAIKVRCLVAWQREFVSTDVIRFAACLAAFTVKRLEEIHASGRSGGWRRSWGRSGSRRRQILCGRLFLSSTSGNHA